MSLYFMNFVWLILLTSSVLIGAELDPDMVGYYLENPLKAFQYHGSERMDGSGTVEERREYQKTFNISEWGLLKCQSPIQLSTTDCITYDQFKPLEYEVSWDESTEANLKNSGRTVVLRFQDHQPLLHGGPLQNDQFVFDHLHFHWGRHNTDDGSEHTIDGKRYSMEAHLVHFNSKYGDFKNASNKSDGLAVLAFFLQAEGNVDNVDFKIPNFLDQITRRNSSVSITIDALKWIQGVFEGEGGYFTYQGSLTTEPFSESVTWILFPTPIRISMGQVAAFRNKHCCKLNCMENNIRQLQVPPNNRKVDVLFVTDIV